MGKVMGMSGNELRQKKDTRKDIVHRYNVNIVMVCTIKQEVWKQKKYMN